MLGDIDDIDFGDWYGCTCKCEDEAQDGDFMYDDKDEA